MIKLVCIKDNPIHLDIRKGRVFYTKKLEPYHGIPYSYYLYEDPNGHNKLGFYPMMYFNTTDEIRSNNLNQLGI